MDATGLGQILGNIEQLKLCGEAVVAFYQACAEAWPEERQFWDDLATDAMVHTTRLHLMQYRVQDSRGAARSIRMFAPAALGKFLGWIESAGARVRAGEIDQRQSLAIARDLERSPIVNEHYHVARKTEPALANYLLSFATEYGEHTQRIAARLGQAVAAAQLP